MLRRQQRLLRQLRRRRKQLQHRERGDILLTAPAQGGGRVAAGAQLRLEAVDAAGPGRMGILCLYNLGMEI